MATLPVNGFNQAGIEDARTDLNLHGCKLWLEDLFVQAKNNKAASRVILVEVLRFTMNFP